MASFEGAISALPTPFKNGSLDRKSFQKFVQFQLDQGIEGLVVNGTTAESPCLTWQEVEELFSMAREISKNRIPILIGTGSNSTYETIEKSIKAQKLGADGLLIVTPYYNKPPQAGLLAHYRSIAESVSVPILLYNVPGRTAVSFTAQTIAELSRLPNIVGCKEATGDLKFDREILDLVSSEFNLTSGDDMTFLDLAIMGGKGVISVLSNIIPKQTAEMMKRARNKDKAVLQDFEKFKKLTSLLFIEANPIPVKAALQMMGLFESDEMRLPLVSISDGNRQLLQAEMKELGLI